MNKNLTIETWRGIAILLVVIGHIIGDGPNGGMKIDDSTSIWRYLYTSIYYFHMPLFTAIAGWVYGYKPIGDKGFLPFLTDKFKRLIVPMITVSTIYYLIQNLTPGTNNKESIDQIWRIYCFPYTFYWYLQSLFVMFVIIAVVDKLCGDVTVKKWGYMLVGSIILYQIQTNIIANNMANFFGFQGALDQLPYFITGIGIQRFGKEMYAKFKVYLYLFAVLGISLFYCKLFVYQIDDFIYKSLLPLVIIPTLMIMLNIKFSSKVFIYLGAYAYTIYLFHGFGTSAGRIIFSYFGIYNHSAIFSLSLLLGVFAPILVDKILSKNGYMRFLFLGKRI